MLVSYEPPVFLGQIKPSYDYIITIPIVQVVGE
jgi:hypothetical protein